MTDIIVIMHAHIHKAYTCLLSQTRVSGNSAWSEIECEKICHSPVADLGGGGGLGGCNPPKRSQARRS